MNTPTHPRHFSDLLTGLTVDPSTGLTGAEAAERLKEGRNELPAPPAPGLLQRVAHQAREPMSLLLLVAALVSLFALQEPIDAAAISAIVILNITVAVAQEERAATALNALRAGAAPTATVLRQATPMVIAAAEVVPGDVLLLSAGDRVAADAWLVEAWSLQADESLLTGESLPVEKAAIQEGDLDQPQAEQYWVAHAGTLITAGSGRAVVFATGAATGLGRIAGQLVAESPQTPLQKELARVSARLGQAAVMIAVVVAGLTLARLGWSAPAAQQAFLTAVALAVAAVPEGLPTVVTLALALGVGRLARQGAIVRNLPAVETLGSTTVLLTDKTGTLTANRMSLTSVIEVGGETTKPAELSGELAERVTEVLSLCNDASLDPPQGDPVEVALLEAFPDHHHRLRENHPRLHTQPFSPERRLMATLHRFGPRYRLLVKGAPEEVLAASSQAWGQEGIETLSGEHRGHLLDRVEELAASGTRVLALALRQFDEAPTQPEAEELTFLALAVLRDPVRPEASSTIDEVAEAGIKLIMVTGDHAGTASAIARQVGIGHKPDQVRTGGELRRDGTESDLGRVRIYARVDPGQKLALVEAFRAAGEVVAVTGDGVNDAPALQRADIGVAMGRGGSQVAREAADLVLTDDDLGLIARAVREGRTIFDNIRKVIDYLVAGNLSEVTVVVAGLAFFPALGVPLFPLQLLWINLLTDGLPALALGFDRPRRQLAPTDHLRGRNLLSAGRLARLGFRGLILAAGAITALVVVRGQGATWAEARTAMFTALVVAHLLYAYVVRLPDDGFASNWRLAGAVVAGLALQAFAVLGPFQEAFRVVAMAPAAWVWATTAGLVPVVLLALAARYTGRQGVNGGLAGDLRP
ncbi:MAG TPA: cation-transporting P-type ATPase [Acidimicrobiia bacterium]|nr:cation-transporting P-type ATPase [Acidimicrobiia bacterium]